MFNTIAIIIAVLVAGVLIFATTKPDTMLVQRNIQIQAPPEKIFPLINDFHSWRDWSPYEKLDPAMRRTLSGAQHGKGAVYEWDGNAKAGKGRMEITDTAAPSKVQIQLHFIKPFEGHNVAEFTLAPQGSATQVTWAIRGENRYLSKVMQVFFNMDKLIGKDFETGLANLKSAAERQST